MQPGCQSIDRQWEEYRLEKQNVTVPQAVLAQEQGLPVDSTDIDPSFNSGFAGSGQDGRATRVRATPTRPSAGGTMGTGATQQTDGFFSDDNESFLNPGISDGFNSGADDFGPDLGGGTTEPAFVPYTVQRGDTMWGLSKEYNVSFPELLEANGMTRDSQLKVGQEILVPSSYGSGAVGAVEVAETETVPGTTIYEVRRGDTLSEIAVRAGTSVSRIKNLNNMTSDRIRIGQKLIVPGEIAITAVEEEVVTVDVDPSDYTAVHKVQSGETVSGIANRYGMTSAELLSVNGIDDPRRLRAGAELKVKPASATSKLSTPSSSNSVTSPIILPPRATAPTSTSTSDSFNATGSTMIIEEDEEGPTAPTIIPSSTTRTLVETEELEAGDDFGPEVFDDFSSMEEVPVERRNP